LNYKIILSKTTSAIFLAFILTTGTITAIFPSSLSSSLSFMTEVHAQSEYVLIDDYNSKYLPYDKDNNHYKSDKDSSSKKSVSLNKIKCINDNININGINAGDISIGNKGQVTSTDTEEGHLGAKSYGGYYNDGYDNNKQDKGFDCIINNNNTNTNVVVDISNQTIPPQTATLTVKKEVFGCNNVDDENMGCQTLQNNDEGWLSCTDPTISNSLPCQGLPTNLFDIEVLDNQNNLIQQFEGSAQGTTIENLEPGTYIVNETKAPFSTDNQLYEDAFVQQACIDAGFTGGGALFNSGANIVYQICFEYEDEQDNDCSTVAMAAEEEKTCIVKNYIRRST
jgi:hypothetical protein